MGNYSFFLPKSKQITKLQIPRQTAVFLEQLLYAEPFSEDPMPGPGHTQPYPYSMEEETEAQKMKELSLYKARTV